METTSPALKKKRGEAFADYVIGRLTADNAFGAMLRRADNPATEFHAWEYLVHWCDIDKSWERIPFAVIAAALARAKPMKDGHLGIGRSIGQCYEDGRNSDAAKAKLRRLLACNTIEEVCRILRPLLRLIQSRGVSVGYGGLLDELLWFGERQKIQWAVDFYGRRDEHDRGNV
jgi:CRISPR system Cascade subunit CasB